jgi:hypothetical protein
MDKSSRAKPNKPEGEWLIENQRAQVGLRKIRRKNSGPAKV